MVKIRTWLSPLHHGLVCTWMNTLRVRISVLNLLRQAIHYAGDLQCMFNLTTELVLKPTCF